jgi:hypothetical protein
LILVERGHQELRVVDLAIAIDVNLLDDLLDLLLIIIDALNLTKSDFQLIRRQCAAAVLIKFLELFRQMIKFLLSQHRLHEKSEHRLLYFGMSSELFQIIKGLREILLLQIALFSHLEPGMLESLLSRGSFLGVDLQKGLD